MCFYRLLANICIPVPHIGITNTRFFYKQCQAEIGKKIKQKLRNTLWLNIGFLKIIRFIHRCYHPKVTRVRLFNAVLMVIDNENEAENEKLIIKIEIDLGLDIKKSILNIKFVSV